MQYSSGWGKEQDASPSETHPIPEGKKGFKWKDGEWIERLRTLVEVAELDDITADELGIHVFTESVDPSMTKLTLEELAE